MAHIEPMDVESDFEDKENLIQVNNILSRTSCTEKGYDEMDVSEMSMRLRFSITPSSSPMSKSYTGNCDNKFYEKSEEGVNDSLINGNISLTQSLNSTLTKVDNKVSKSSPLQPLATDLLGDINRNPLSQRSLDLNVIDPNVTIAINDNVDENLSLPSTSSSTAQTPEAITPTKGVPKDGGSPIMRGLKSVFGMFRSSTSPIPPLEVLPTLSNVAYDSPTEDHLEPYIVSTPISSLKNKDPLSKRNSPLKESLVFNDDLEKELLWKDETTILFKDEKIPIHKLFLQPSHLDSTEVLQSKCKDDHSVKYLDIPHNEMRGSDKIDTDIEYGAAVNANETISALESDSEFLDCETTFTKHELDITESHENNTNTNNIESVTINKQIEHHELVSQQSILPTSSISYTLNSIIALDCAPKELITEKAEMIESQSIEIATEISELNSLKINEQGTICENNGNDCVVKEKLSENLNVEATYECNNLTSTIELYEACKQVKDTLDSDNSNVPDESIIVDTHIKHSKNIDDLIIAIAEENFDANEYKNTIDNTDIILDVPHSDGSSQLISNEDKLTDLKMDNKTTVCVNKEEIFGTVNNNNIQIPCEAELLGNKNGTDTCSKDFNSESITVISELLSNIYLSENVLQNLAETLAITANKLDNTTGDENICKESKINYMGDEYNELEVKETNELHDGTDNFDRTFFENKPEICITNKEYVSIPRDISLPSDNEINHLADKNENVVSIATNDDIDVEFNKTYNNYELNKSSESNTAELVSNGESNIECENDSKLLTENILTTKYVVDYNTNSTIEIDKHIEDSSIKNNVQFNDIQSESNVAESCDLMKCELLNEQNMHVSEISDKQAMETSLTFIKNLDLTLDLEDKYSNNICSGLENNNLSKVKELDSEVETINVEMKPQLLEKNVDQNDIVLDSNVYQIISKNISEVVPIIEDDEIITSNGSSPYVLVTEFGSMQHDRCNLEDIENPIENNEFETTPPISPKLTKKGYDINFDDIDDPFATKTKIRLSPTPERPITNNIPCNNTHKTKTEVIRRESSKNRRKSQPERKVKKSKKFNATIDAVFRDEHLKINDSFDTIFPGVGTENVDIEIDNNTAIHKIDVKVSNMSNVADNSFSVKVQGPESDSTAINSPNNSVLEQENMPTLSNIENKITIDAEKNSTMSELEVNSTISVIENNNTSTNIKNEHFLTETNRPIELESNYPEFSEDIDNTTNSLLFEKKAENLLQSPIDDSQSNATFQVESLEVNTKNDEKTLESILTETVETTNEKENQNIVKMSSSEDVGIFSSKHTEDDDHSVTDILTEDEDTIEGPFIESDMCREDFREGANDNMMQFDSHPTPAPTNYENIDNDELFIDAEAFEFLLNQNKTNIIADSGKESLFLKFDPLFAKGISSDGIVAALSKIQKRQNTPKRPPKPSSTDNFGIKLAKPGPSQIDSSYVVMDNSEVSSSKPMMVVNPAINPVVMPRKLTPSLNRRSLTFSSPAIAVIDRLLSLNGNNSLIDRNESISEPGGERNDTDIALTQLRELLAEKEIHVYNLRCESKELKDRLAKLESQMKSIESETEQRLRKIKNLNENLAEKTKINKSMSAVVEEYERTIASLISDIQQEKKCNAAERMKLVRERDEQTAHLSSMEASFSDLHSKYEKSKQIILSMKANEDKYKKSLQEFDDSLVKMQSNYELLKQHATAKLNHANQELEKINKTHESEVLKLNALIKRRDLHITSLEETLSQKTKANEELTAICDELINKVG